jgi:hypothetical protein
MSVLQAQEKYDLQEQLLYPIILLKYSMFVDSFFLILGSTTRRSAVGSSLGQAWHAKMLRERIINHRYKKSLP